MGRMFLKRFVRINQSFPPDMLMRKNVIWLAAESVPQFQENNVKTSKKGLQNKLTIRFAILSTRSNANKFLRESQEGVKKAMQYRIRVGLFKRLSLMIKTTFT